MKHKYILLFVFLMATSVIRAQITKVKPITVYTNYYKTTHLIFPSDIKYFNSVTDLVSVDQPVGVPFVLRLKATEKELNEVTNISVTTSDGKFYDFEVVYKENLVVTNLYLENMRYIMPEKIGIDDITQTHIIFDKGIKYVDIGDECVTSSLAFNTTNVVWIKAEDKKFLAGETNISVVTEDKQFYTYDLVYSQKTVSSYYTSKDVAKRVEPVLLPANDFTDNERLEIKEKSYKFQRKIYSLGEQRDGIVFSITNVFIHKNMILFRCEIDNTSSIPYNMEYVKFNIIDKKKHKLTASQELEQRPIYLEDYKPSVEPHKSHRFIIGFETFTIPDDKFLRIEINEKNGGRHVNFKVSNKNITDGQVF